VCVKHKRLGSNVMISFWIRHPRRSNDRKMFFVNSIPGTDRNIFPYRLLLSMLRLQFALSLSLSLTLSLSIYLSLFLSLSLSLFISLLSFSLFTLPCLYTGLSLPHLSLPFISLPFSLFCLSLYCGFLSFSFLLSVSSLSLFLFLSVSSLSPLSLFLGNFSCVSLSPLCFWNFS
jgi:hypothetical protein